MDPAACVRTVQRLRMSSGIYRVYSKSFGTFCSSSVSVISLPRFLCTAQCWTAFRASALVAPPRDSSQRARRSAPCFFPTRPSLCPEALPNTPVAPPRGSSPRAPPTALSIPSNKFQNQRKIS